MATYFVMASNSNKQNCPAWWTVKETNSLEDAKRVYETFCDKCDNKEADFGAHFRPITMVALFVGAQLQKPRLLHDRRDKSGWILPPAVGQLVNSVNSDFTINK